jgi:hypothetical protein
MEQWPALRFEARNIGAIDADFDVFVTTAKLPRGWQVRFDADRSSVLKPGDRYLGFAEVSEGMQRQKKARSGVTAYLQPVVQGSKNRLAAASPTLSGSSRRGASMPNCLR